MKNQTIQVVLNRWVYLDENGDPATRVMNEEGFGYIGATVTNGTDVLAYSDEPVSITASRYVRKLVGAGALFPANEESARVVGVPFVAIHERTAEAKNKAIKEFEAQHGNGAWAAIHDAKSPLAANKKAAE